MATGSHGTRRPVHSGLKSSRIRRIMSGSPLVTLHIIPRKRSALGRVDAGKVIAKLVPSHPAARQRWGEAAAGRAWAIAILPTTLHMLTPNDASQHRIHTRARLLVQRAWAQRHEGATFMYAGRVSSPETPVARPKRQGLTTPPHHSKERRHERTAPGSRPPPLSTSAK